MGHGSSVPQMMFPVQGMNKYGTTDFIMCKSFKIDFSTMDDETGATEVFTKGSVIWGFRIKITTAAAGGTSMAFGFTGTEMMSATTALANIDAIGDIVGPELGANASASCLVLTANDTFDATAVGTFTDGKCDVDIWYSAPRDVDFDATFREWVL